MRHSETWIGFEEYAGVERKFIPTLVCKRKTKPGYLNKNTYTGSEVGPLHIVYPRRIFRHDD